MKTDLRTRKGFADTLDKIRTEEETRILAEARASPELSCRQLALTITDSNGAYLSESTVYRVLKRSGLIKPAEVVGFKAAKEYRRKTKQPNELWASIVATSK